jgi:cysteine-rich repeat protein
MLAATGCGGAPDGDASREVGTTEQALAPTGSNARFISTNLLPATLFPGERRLIQVTMQNNGTASPANDWKTASPAYALSAVNGSWGWSYNYVPSTVAVGLSNTFTFAITAPPTSQSFTARMSAVGQGVFGDTVTVPVAMTAPAPQWGCTYVSGSSTIPTTMAPSENRTITVTVRNTGTDTWPANSIYMLSQDAPTSLWGQTSIQLKTAVAPGATTSFSFGIKAPATAGTYSFVREMANQSQMGLFRSYGFCVNTPIVVGGPPTLNSSVTSQSFTTPMAPSSTGTATINFTNTGSETWTNDGTYVLSSESSPVNLFGVTSVKVPTTTLANASVSITFLYTSPATPGTYNAVWQLRKLSGTNAGFYGAIVSVPIVVSGAVTPTYGSTVVSQTVPTLVTVGTNQQFIITMKNTGSAAWTGSNFVLYSTSSPTNVWNITQSALGASETVAANAQRVFTLNVKAPTTPGTYNSSWRMNQLGGNGLFGATALQAVTVTNCGNGAIDSGEQCDDGNLVNGDGCSNACQFEQVAEDLAMTGLSEHTLKGTGAGANVSPVTVGDVTGDGVPDIMVSSTVPVAGTGSNKGGAGSVYGYLGGAAFRNGSTSIIPAGSMFQISGADGDDALATVATARMLVGQIVGTATPDLVVSASGADGPANGRSNCGEVYILAGGSGLTTAGLINLGATTMPSQVTAHIIGKTAGDALVVLAIADLTGDGVNDLLLGAPGDSTNGAGAGAMYIVTGGSLSGDIDLASPPGGVVVFRILGEAAGNAFGAMGRAATGDLNGDGKADILAGCAGCAPAGRTRAGEAYAKFGPFAINLDFKQAVGTSTGPAVKWLGRNNTDGLGTAVAIGNVLGTTSSTAEAVIGGIQLQKSGTQVGGVQIWSGITSGTTYDLSTATVPTSTILGIDANDDCGSALALGDMNHDGLQDIAIGCSSADGPTNARSAAGEVDVVLGAATLPVTYDMTTRRSSFVLYGADTGGQLARHNSSIAVADLDGDGKADVCSGAFLGFNGSVRAGRVDCVMSPF